MTGVTTNLAGRCGYMTDRGQCKRDGTTVVGGVEPLLCKQHARIVATEPGSTGVLRTAPVGVDAIVAELGHAITDADITRCVTAITEQLAGLHTDAGMKPEIAIALQDARARVRGARR